MWLRGMGISVSILINKNLKLVRVLNVVYICVLAKSPFCISRT